MVIEPDVRLVAPVDVIVPPDWVSAPAATVKVPALNAPPEIAPVPPVKLARPDTATVLPDLNVPPETASDAVESEDPDLVVVARSIVPALSIVAPLTVIALAVPVSHRRVALAWPTVRAAIVDETLYFAV